MDLVTDKILKVDMNYYSNNNLKLLEGYIYNSGFSALKYRLNYSPEGDTLLPGLGDRGGYIIDFRWPEFVADETDYKYYDGALIDTEVKTIYANRQYNERGYLKSQKATLKKIKPAKADEVNEFRYEYIEL